MKSWLELESRFRNLAPNLRHYRLDAQWGAAGEHWRIAGGGSNPTTQEYELLASLGGELLGKVLKKKNEADQALLQITDPKLRWYNALKNKSPMFGHNGYAEQIKEDGGSAGFIFTGTVDNFAEASANLCLSFQTSHPIVERKSVWQWIHENYIKSVVIAIITAIVGIVAKHFIH